MFFNVQHQAGTVKFSPIPQAVENITANMIPMIARIRIYGATLLVLSPSYF